MTNLEEIACTYINRCHNELDVNIGIRTAMEKYAEWYARKCLKIAAESAKTTRCPEYDTVNKQTILNITLPNHE